MSARTTLPAGTTIAQEIETFLAGHGGRIKGQPGQVVSTIAREIGHAPGSVRTIIDQMFWQQRVYATYGSNRRTITGFGLTASRPVLTAN